MKHRIALALATATLLVAGVTQAHQTQDPAKAPAKAPAAQEKAPVAAPASGDDAVIAWYLAIARNTAIDGVRSEQRHRRGRVAVDDDTRPVPALEPTADDPEANWLVDEQRAETRARVRAAIFDLPASQRDVVVLHKLRGLPMQTVAEHLRVRPGAARVRAHRAYASLAKRLAGATQRPAHGRTAAAA